MDPTAAGRPESVTSRAQIERALQALSDLDLLKLKRVAQVRTLGLTAFDWQDLFQETIVRLLGGSRVWPKDVPFMAVLVQTMRSVAHEARSQAARLPIAESSLRRSAEDDDSYPDLAGLAVAVGDPERDAMARNTIRAIEALFEGDANALAVLNALAEGMTPQEVQKAAGMTPLRYQTTQKRIRRRLAKAFGPEE